jgi:hypothetical protein
LNVGLVVVQVVIVILQQWVRVVGVVVLIQKR